MNLLSPSETSDMVDCVIAAWERLLLSVAVVAIGIAVELLDVPGQRAAEPVQEGMQRIRRG